MMFQPSWAIYELGGDFYDPVEVASFPDYRLRFKDDYSADLIGLSKVDWVERFGYFKPFASSLSQPLALRYHGHQFRHYNPDIGDGRGFLYAQCHDQHGRSDQRYNRL